MTHPRLKPHYSLVAHGPDIVELRHGAWYEPSLTLSDASGSGRLLSILSRLDGVMSPAEVAEAVDVPLSDVETLLGRLAEEGVLEFGPRNVLDLALVARTQPLLLQENGLQGGPPAIRFVGDAEVTDEMRRVLGLGDDEEDEDLGYLREALRTAGDAWHFDALALEHAARPFNALSGALTVFGVATVNPLELRAFNRMSLHLRLPWLHAAIDGPFLLIGPTFVPFRWACYECLEARIVMNLRDPAGYQQYTRALAEARVTTPLAGPERVSAAMLASLASFEALNFTRTGAAFTTGRMLTVFLPTLEFAFHEVLRLPGCPACGAVQERDDRELYLDTRALSLNPSWERPDDGP